MTTASHSSRPVVPAASQTPSGTWRMLTAKGTSNEKLPKGLDAAWDAGVGHLQPLVPRQRGILRRAQRIVEMEKQFSQTSDRHLREQATELKIKFRLGRAKARDVNEAFALIREVAHRTVGLKPYMVQIAAALALEAGCCAEQATGEGKTLSATMPATVAGWRGHGCHIITVNDYLAQRDANEMNPIYRMCDLSCAHVESSMSPHDRRASYAADITYTTNKEVAADFLRDRLNLGQRRGLPAALMAKMVDGVGLGTDKLVMRGLTYAIIDEADSVLIDEAVTPLIISSASPNHEQVEAFAQAAALTEELDPETEFHVDHRYREVNFTQEGRLKIAELTKDLGGIWSGIRRREELISQALTARHLYLLDKQYVIQDGKVVIVDEFTGRLMPDRTWRAGLHQAVEAKENLTINPPKETLARVSFQRFFRLYSKLAGMTGTAWEGRYEFWQIYHLPVVRIPTNRPSIRRVLPDRVFGTSEAKWKAIVENIQRVHKKGRPILVGTRSVDASEHLSQLLEQQKLDHVVLNAVRHAEEAQIVAGAGQPGRITVATNMAGRGTDIKPGRGIAELGGLHVLATERHEAARVDRQLFGRTGRQGDPGDAVAFVSLDDELIQRHAPKLVRQLINRSNKRDGPVTDRLGRKLFNTAQHRAERLALRQRKSVLKSDDWLDEFLGFAGSES